jgi:hypothetical protein
MITRYKKERTGILVVCLDIRILRIWHALVKLKPVGKHFPPEDVVLLWVQVWTCCTQAPRERRQPDERIRVRRREVVNVLPSARAPEDRSPALVGDVIFVLLNLVQSRNVPEVCCLHLELPVNLRISRHADKEAVVECDLFRWHIREDVLTNRRAPGDLPRMCHERDIESQRGYRARRRWVQPSRTWRREVE